MFFMKDYLVSLIIIQFIYSCDYVEENKMSSIISNTKPISLSYEISNMNKLYLNINVSDLENFDFEQPLTNSMKEQLVIYNLFLEQFLWLSYMNNSYFKSCIDDIAEKLKMKDQNCFFTKHYNILLMKGCSEVFYFFGDSCSNMIDRHEMCLIKRQNGRFYFLQKDLSNEKDQELVFEMICDYYKKRLFKKLNLSSELISNLKKEICISLSNKEKVEFLDCAITVKAFENLVNLCLFTVLHNIILLPDRTCNVVTLDCIKTFLF